MRNETGLELEPKLQLDQNPEKTTTRIGDRTEADSGTGTDIKTGTGQEAALKPELEQEN